MPLVLNTNYEDNNILPRTSEVLVKEQIIQDLKQAVENLPEKIESEKIRPNKWAAKALLARVYLYEKQWALAEELSNEIITSNLFILNDDLSKVFLKNSSEAILQFYPTQSNQNTPDGLAFLPATATETPKYYLTETLLQAFEPGDQRKTIWVGTRTFSGQIYCYPAKYKVINTGTLSEYYMIFRLGEQYLIRAEARIQQDNTRMGIADLNIVRRRARAIPSASLPYPLPDIDPGLDKANALLALEKERRIELMTELGHRWFDLKRTGRANDVLGQLKSGTWQQTDILC